MKPFRLLTGKMLYPTTGLGGHSQPAEKSKASKNFGETWDVKFLSSTLFQGNNKRRRKGPNVDQSWYVKMCKVGRVK
jgi:hypothetical protein